jgi:hypothetical protein
MVFKKNYKCEICVKHKLTKLSFQTIERSNESLNLIHSDINDLKYLQIRDGKNYYITLINDQIRNCYTYLFKSKDKALEMFKNYKTKVENQLHKN